jgi:hypothetical protein
MAGLLTKGVPCIMCHCISQVPVKILPTQELEGDEFAPRLGTLVARVR